MAGLPRNRATAGLSANPPGFGFVDVGPDVQRVNRPHGHQRTGQHARLRILAEPDIDVENRPIHWRVDHGLVPIGPGPIECSFRLVELCLRLPALG